MFILKLWFDKTPDYIYIYILYTPSSTMETMHSEGF